MVGCSVCGVGAGAQGEESEEEGCRGGDDDDAAISRQRGPSPVLLAFPSQALQAASSPLLHLCVVAPRPWGLCACALCVQ